MWPKKCGDQQVYLIMLGSNPTFFIGTFSLFMCKFQNILSEFQKEHDSFLRSRGSKSENAIAPWVGHPKEEALKEEILSLSTV